MYGKAITDLAWDYKRRGLVPDINELCMQSDRCGYQFWGKRNFALIAGFHEEVEGVTTQHDSTASNRSWQGKI
jgi:hypothetical protein